MRLANLYSAKEAIECGAQDVEIKNLEAWVVVAAGLCLPVHGG